MQFTAWSYTRLYEQELEIMHILVLTTIENNTRKNYKEMKTWWLTPDGLGKPNCQSIMQFTTWSYTRLYEEELGIMHIVVELEQQ